MQRDTLLLTVEMFIMELCGSILHTILGCYHLFYSISTSPESRSMFDCWLMICWDLIFLSVIGIIYLELSFDRFYAAVFPINYQSRSKYYLYILSAVAWAVALLMFLFSLLAISFDDDVAVPLCILRYGLGLTYFSVFSCTMIFLSFMSLTLYVTTVIILKVQIRLILKRGGNVLDVKRRMNSKVTKALATSACAHLLTFTTAATGTQLVTYFLPYDGASYGPLFKTFYHFGGITCLPIYCIFQRQFRLGFIHLVELPVTCSACKNGNNSVTPLAVSENPVNVFAAHF